MLSDRSRQRSVMAAGLVLGLGLFVAGVATSPAQAHDAAGGADAGKAAAAAAVSTGKRQATGASGAISGDHVAGSLKAPADGRATRSVGSPNANPRQGVYYYGPITLSPGAAEWIEVYCPSGMLATSGGESNSSSGGVTLRSTYGLSNGLGWHVVVTNDSASTATATIYTVCFSGLTGYSQPEQTEQVDAGAAYYDEMNDCPAGQQIVGAGVSTDSLLDTIGALEPLQNYEPPYQYTMLGDQVGNTDTVDNIDATMQEICASGINNEYIWYSSGTSIAAGAYSMVSQACPAGTLLVGGGGDGDSGIRYTDSFPDGNGWGLWAYNQPDNGLDPNFVAAAICGT